MEGTFFIVQVESDLFELEDFLRRDHFEVKNNITIGDITRKITNGMRSTRLNNGLSKCSSKTLMTHDICEWRNVGMLKIGPG